MVNPNNLLPATAEEISEERFAHLFMINDFTLKEFRQVFITPNPSIASSPLCNCKIFQNTYHPTIGVIMVDDWKNKKLRFYVWGEKSEWKLWSDKVTAANY